MFAEINREDINDAISRFLENGGSINRIERVAGEPVFGNDSFLSEDLLEMIEVQDLDFV